MLYRDYLNNSGYAPPPSMMMDPLARRLRYKTVPGMMQGQEPIGYAQDGVAPPMEQQASMRGALPMYHQLPGGQWGRVLGQPLQSGGPTYSVNPGMYRRQQPTQDQGYQIGFNSLGGNKSLGREFGDVMPRRRRIYA